MSIWKNLDMYILMIHFKKRKKRNKNKYKYKIYKNNHLYLYISMSTMSPITALNFLDKDNISMIWEVIRDEEIFKFLSNDIQQNVATVFANNIKGFFDSEIHKTNSLIDINKKYIMLVLNYIKNKYANMQPNKIKIHEEITPIILQKELITYEEIQNDKKSQFEKDLSKRQEEFTNLITKIVPPVPEFKDKVDDTPITEMDKMIQEMLSQRNYDVEQINKNYQNTDTWLKPEETSIKKDKNIYSSNSLIVNSGKNEYNTINQNTINQNRIEREETKSKNVSWGENSEIVDDISNNLNMEDNIFKKLKRITHSDEHVKEMNNVKEDRIQFLEKEVRNLNTKMDILIDLLKQNK